MGSLDIVFYDLSLIVNGLGLSLGSGSCLGCWPAPKPMLKPCPWSGSLALALALVVVPAVERKGLGWRCG